jgi:class 3 adenylate cyclase
VANAQVAQLAVLIAYLSGSDVLLKSIGQKLAADAVSECLAGLRAAAEKFGGTVVKTVGGQFIANFADADSAIQAASAMQASFSTRADGLALRVGLTVGPVIRENQDIFGDTVNLAARLAEMANPRQILTTRQAVERLSPFLRTVCRSLYNASVKGRAEKVPVYEAAWARDRAITIVGDTREEEPRGPALLKLSWRGQVWNLDERRDTIHAGRGAENEIVVAGDNVSRHHARIFLRMGKFVIADESANGTYLRVPGRAEIYLHREEFILLGRGSIGLGQSLAEVGDAAITFEVQ